MGIKWQWLLVLAAALGIMWFFWQQNENFEAPAGLQIVLRHGELTEKIELEEAVVGFVAAEMPAAYGREALAAQAVAARTYAWRRFLNDGEVCDDSSHCLAYMDETARRKRWGKDFSEYEAKLREAVEQTAGLVLIADGELVEACFHASCGGMTEDAAVCWGGASVYPAAACYWEGGGSISSCFVPKAELAAKLGVAEKDLGLLYVVSHTASGRVRELRCGDTRWSGAEFREALGLASCRISWLATAEGFWFTCLGSGHGVGLCQQGAGGLAAAGAGWREILEVYYAGCEIGDIGLFAALSDDLADGLEDNMEKKDGEADEPAES